MKDYGTPVTDFILHESFMHVIDNGEIIIYKFNNEFNGGPKEVDRFDTNSLDLNADDQFLKFHSIESYPNFIFVETAPNTALSKHT